MRVAGCLIVRDEAAFLPDALASLAGAVDELVVVDTGSTDGTPDLARAAGATVVEIQWAHDFAAARNVAHEHTRAGWLLWLDADERLIDPGGVRRAVSEAPPDVGGFVVERHDVVIHPDSGRRDAIPIGMVRLLRAHPAIRWQGRVHERPGERVLAAGFRLGVAPDVVLRHLVAERTPAVLEAKQRRYLGLLDGVLADDPADAWTRYYRGKTRWYLGDREGARADFDAVTADRGARAFLRASALVMTAAVHLEAGDLAAAGAAVDASLALVPSQSLARVIGGDVAFAAGRYADALAAWSRVRTSLAETEGDPLHGDLWLRPAAKAYKVGCAHLALGRVADAAASFQRGLGAEPDDAACVYGLAGCAEATGDVANAIELLEAALRRDPAWQDPAERLRRLSARRAVEGSPPVTHGGSVA
jgi:hypothetical protein